MKVRFTCLLGLLVGVSSRLPVHKNRERKRNEEIGQKRRKMKPTLILGINT
jgi:hypothetical protein